MKDKKKYKVLYIISNSALYGDNKAMLNILDGVLVLGIVPLVVMSSKGKMSDELSSRKINYKVFNYGFLIYPPFYSIRDLLLFFPRLFKTIWYNYTAYRQVSIVIRDFNPDIIHTNVGPIHIGFYLAKKFNIAHVWHIREYQEFLNMHPIPSKNRFISSLYSSNNYPIAIAKGVYSHYFMKNNARIIYDGVMKSNAIRFESNKEKYFLFVGRLEDGKGVIELINAFVEFCIYNADFELLIVGNGASIYTESLHKLVKNSQICDRIKFLGYRNDVYDLMTKATALVVPSRHEGFGFITVEAMFNGCLVIGNNSTGTNEILEKDDLGILYSGHDELIVAMKNVVLKGIESFYPIIKKAQDKAVVLYSNEQNVIAVYECYKDVLSKKAINNLE
jgi:glycosyltransferase involved in cell wall biosynthesis